jgi:hypothetical protein
MRIKSNRVILHHATPAVGIANKTVVVINFTLANDAPDDCIETGTVAATRQYPDPHR